MGDHPFRYDPPWPYPYKDWAVTVPILPHPGAAQDGGAGQPVEPPKPNQGVEIKPWNLERLKEYLALLKEIKALEDSIGCPCPEEREKPDYIKLFEDRIATLEGKICQCETCDCKKG